MTYRKLVRFSPGLLRISDRLFLSCSLVTLNTWLPRINLGWGFPSLHKVLLCPLVAQMVKNLPAMQETQVGSLGKEDFLGEGMATHSSILAWIIPWTEEPGRLQSIGSQRVGHNWETNPYRACTFSDSPDLWFIRKYSWKNQEVTLEMEEEKEIVWKLEKNKAKPEALQSDEPRDWSQVLFLGP